MRSPSTSRVVLAVGLLVCTGRAAIAQPAASAATCAPASGLIYVGDANTTPTDFLDPAGRPAGIHVELVRELQRITGIPIAIALMDRVDATAAILSGRAHLIALGRIPSREAQFDFLAPTVRSRMSVVFHPDTRRVASREDLHGLRISTIPGSPSHELFAKMPAAQRPNLVLVRNRDEALSLWKDRQVDGMAGPGSALVWSAHQSGQHDFVEMPFETVMNHFATIKGCGESLATLTEAMETLRNSGVVDMARERWSTPPESNLWPRLRLAGAIVLAILGGVLAWTWSLRRQVRERTAALEASKAAAEAATRAKSEFLATMSHEIRTPLNAVIATASVLETTSLDQDQRDLVAVIRHGGHSLLSVVSDVLDFSKVEAGRLDLHCQPFEVRALLRETTALVNRTASDKGLELILDIHPAVPQWLDGDCHRLRQVLLNLTSNAVKFTTRGSVEVRACAGEAEPDGLVRLHVDVRDTGIGIPPERLHAVFQPFSQADSSTTRRFGGTGLGLSISRSLIELMGGTISVASDIGHGSTFHFDVPLPLASEPASVRHAQTRSQAPLRVLMAEDNPINQLIQRRMTTHAGHTCDVVSNGREAIAAASRINYDVVVLDLQMPVMGGLDAAIGIRQQSHRPWLIVLTADVTADTRHACLAAGIDDFLTKPITIDTLSAALAKVPVDAISAVA